MWCAHTGAASGDSTAYPNPTPAFPPASRAALATSEGSAEAGSSHTDALEAASCPSAIHAKGPARQVHPAASSGGAAVAGRRGQQHRQHRRRCGSGARGGSSLIEYL